MSIPASIQSTLANVVHRGRRRAAIVRRALDVLLINNDEAFAAMDDATGKLGEALVHLNDALSAHSDAYRRLYASSTELHGAVSRDIACLDINDSQAAALLLSEVTSLRTALVDAQGQLRDLSVDAAKMRSFRIKLTAFDTDRETTVAKIQNTVRVFCWDTLNTVFTQILVTAAFHLRIIDEPGEDEEVLSYAEYTDQIIEQVGDAAVVRAAEMFLMSFSNVAGSLILDSLLNPRVVAAWWKQTGSSMVHSETLAACHGSLGSNNDDAVNATIDALNNLELSPKQRRSCTKAAEQSIRRVLDVSVGIPVENQPAWVSEGENSLAVVLGSTLGILASYACGLSLMLQEKPTEEVEIQIQRAENPATATLVGTVASDGIVAEGDAVTVTFDPNGKQPGDAQPGATPPVEVSAVEKPTRQAPKLEKIGQPKKRRIFQYTTQSGGTDEDTLVAALAMKASNPDRTVHVVYTNGDKYAIEDGLANPLTEEG